MPKRALDTFPSHMDTQPISPLNCLRRSHAAAERYSENVSVGCNNTRTLSRSVINDIEAPNTGAVQSTRTRRPRLQKVDTDTFRLLPDDILSPKAPSRNALIFDDLSSNIHNKTNHDFHTSKTPQNQGIRTPEGQQPPQALVNRRKSSQGSLISSGSPLSRSFILVTSYQMEQYFHLMDTPLIAKFLKYDSCLRVSDKYLLAMVFAYFARANTPTEEYTEQNFFAALYLAHDMEEDEEDHKYEIYPWALGTMWKVRYKRILDLRTKLWKRMDYRGIVSRKCCDEIMAIAPDHPIWKRERKEHHSGAIRPWLKGRHDDGMLIGPNGIPRHCDLCNPPLNDDSVEDSLSPESATVFLQMDTSSSFEEYTAADVTGVSTSSAAGFNINDIQKMLVSSNSAVKSSSGRGTGDASFGWGDFSGSGDVNTEMHRRED